jgi:hypothetical protein
MRKIYSSLSLNSLLHHERESPQALTSISAPGTLDIMFPE